MNNNTNNLDPILDYILHNDNPDTNKPMSNELLGFLLSDENALFSPQPQLHAPQPILHTTAIQKSEVPHSPPHKKESSSHHSNSSPSEEDDEPTDAQLKLMPSKERRQLRNKISARNFRNRRKEYMATLEDRMDKCQAENSQLKLEVKWVRDMMDKLQSENDRLRLELALCKGGIQQPVNMNTSTVTAVSPSPSSLSSSPPAPPCFAGSTNTTTIPSPDWDLVYHPSASIGDHTNNNIYLAHAAIPNWDLSSLFEKPKPTSSSSQELIKSYPLLAPALMSIVLQHTMTMTTEEMVKHAQLTDPSSLPTFEYQPEDKFVQALSDTVLWKHITNPPVITEQAVVDTKSEPETEATREFTNEEIQEYMEKRCPLFWVQKQFCKFILFHVVVKYPQLEKPCRTYLPICDKFRLKNTASC